MDNSRIKLFGLYIDNFSMAETLEKIDEFILSGKPHQHVVVNVNKAIQSAKNEEIKKIINKCDLINADGMPIVWASRFFGKPLKGRVTGIDLFYSLLGHSQEKKYKVYFLGATQGIIENVTKKSMQSYPSLKIAGYRNGYWRDSEEKKVADAIKKSKPDILFVGIPSPKKEIFLSKHLSYMNIPFVTGVGGTFDVFAGKIKRAPVWMQKHGLEWFYRFKQEPMRLFWRYFSQSFKFAVLVLREAIKPLD